MATAPPTRPDRFRATPHGSAALSARPEATCASIFDGMQRASRSITWKTDSADEAFQSGFDVMAERCVSLAVSHKPPSALVALHALTRAAPPTFVLPVPALPPAEPIPPEPPPLEPPPTLPPPEPPPSSPVQPPSREPTLPEPVPPPPPSEPPPPELTSAPPPPPLLDLLASRLRGGGKGPVGTASHLRALNATARLSSTLGVVRRHLGRPPSPPPPSPAPPPSPPPQPPTPTSPEAPPLPRSRPSRPSRQLLLRQLGPSSSFAACVPSRSSMAPAVRFGAC